MDLAGWPPPPAGAFDPHGGGFAITPEQATIKTVVRTLQDRVDFICTFEGKDLNHLFKTWDEKTSQKVTAILRGSTGKTLSSVGMIEIPND